MPRFLERLKWKLFPLSAAQEELLRKIARNGGYMRTADLSAGEQKALAVLVRRGMVDPVSGAGMLGQEAAKNPEPPLRQQPGGKDERILDDG